VREFEPKRCGLGVNLRLRSSVAKRVFLPSREAKPNIWPPMNADRTKTGGTFSDLKAHAVAGTVTILQGNGDGSFQAPTYFEAGSGSYGITQVNLTTAVTWWWRISLPIPWRFWRI
jgi:hypothetical protein